jgi:cytochrome c oxidase subunit 2
VLTLLLVFAPVLVAFAQPERAADSNIGQAAAERAAAEGAPLVTTSEAQVKGLVTWVKVLGALLFIAVLILIERISNLVDYNPFRRFSANYFAPRFFVLVMLGMGILLVFHIINDTPKLLPGSASEHGIDIDLLIIITTAITGLAFVAVQAVLTYYTFKYRTRPGAKALYYPDNHKLEMLWTVIPAIGLAGMIIPGLKYWDNYSYPEHDAQTVHMEVVAEQFRWSIHYPGADGELGKGDYRQISAENPLGLDSLDTNAPDDFTADTIVVPVGRQVHVRLRSKDVLHGFYLPHFRTNIYAVPGMPTEVTFKPLLTTEQARQQYGRADFDYELACTQICGPSHYNMRRVVRVVTSEEYEAWFKAKADARRAELNPAATPAPATSATDSTQTALSGQPAANASN